MKELRLFSAGGGLRGGAGPEPWRVVARREQPRGGSSAPGVPRCAAPAGGAPGPASPAGLGTANGWRRLEPWAPVKYSHVHWDKPALVYVSCCFLVLCRCSWQLCC